MWLNEDDLVYLKENVLDSMIQHAKCEVEYQILDRGALFITGKDCVNVASYIN